MTIPRGAFGDGARRPGRRVVVGVVAIAAVVEAEDARVERERGVRPASVGAERDRGVHIPISFERRNTCVHSAYRCDA
jgi:hypothetical protein